MYHHSTQDRLQDKLLRRCSYSFMMFLVYSCSFASREQPTAPAYGDATSREQSPPPAYSGEKNQCHTVSSYSRSLDL